MKKRRISFLFFVLTGVFFLGELSAAVIKLKSGEVVEGDIAERTDEYVRIQLSGIPVTYFLDTVESIDGQKIEVAEKKAPEPLEPSQPAAVGSGKNEAVQLEEKIRAAQKGIKILQVRCLNTTDMEEILHLKVEEVYTIDFTQKIIRSIATTQEYNFDFNFVLKESIDKMKREGMPQEKIKKAETIIAGVSSQMQKTMDQTVEKIKKYKRQIVISDKFLYMNTPDNKWLKMSFSGAGVFWQALDKIWKGSSGDEIKKALEGSGAFSQEQLKPLVAFADTYGKNLASAESMTISDDVFAGKPCYRRDYKGSVLSDLFKEAILSSLQAKADKGGANAEINSVDYADYISKDDYLSLGLKMNIVMSFSSPEYPKAMKVFVSSDETRSYPAEKIILPTELAGAALVSSDEEFKKILQESMLGTANPQGTRDVNQNPFKK